jgi:hypothetical protein
MTSIETLSNHVFIAIKKEGRKYHTELVINRLIENHPTLEECVSC